MNRQQRIALWVGLANLAVILLFPPFDSFSYTDTQSLVFAGFQFVFGSEHNELLNYDMLFLEVVVLLINVAIVWLLLRDVKHILVARRHFNYQNAILLMVAVNLTAALLFPPFESSYAMSKAVLPSFQGFYFIFSAGAMLTIVTPILYIEVIFVLFNGAVLWLLFRKNADSELTPQQAMELMRELSHKG